jgi:hypothetical protein
MIFFPNLIHLVHPLTVFSSSHNFFLDSFACLIHMVSDPSDPEPDLKKQIYLKNSKFDQILS